MRKSTVRGIKVRLVRVLGIFITGSATNKGYQWYLTFNVCMYTVKFTLLLSDPPLCRLVTNI